MTRRKETIRELMHEYNNLEESHPNKKELKSVLEDELMFIFPNSGTPAMLDAWIRNELKNELIEHAEVILSGSFEGQIREELLELYIKKIEVETEKLETYPKPWKELR
tara:strand:+ start:167 stop:490 length:324 start_codon:yes stop_codon:yes gene_type:complete